MKKLTVSLFMIAWGFSAVHAEVKRTPSGKPDLSGFYEKIMGTKAGTFVAQALIIPITN